MEHGIETATYVHDGYKQYLPYISCLCGDEFMGISWESVGQQFDEHLLDSKK